MVSWTEVTVPLKEHLEALKVADQRALQIKDRADETALELARTIQTYKDEKANLYREQLTSERGNYATHNELQNLSDKTELLLKPLVNFVAEHHGSSNVTDPIRGLFYAIGGGVITFLILKVLNGV